MRKYLLVLLLLLVPVLACAIGQKKIYTKKMRLSSFPTSTVKVVSSGSLLLDAELKRQVASRWYASPFEFCSTSEFLAKRGNPDSYFLRFVTEGGVVFLQLEKGGVESSPDPMKLAFKVVSIPVGSEDQPSGRELLYMAAFVDIIQEFTLEAMESDRTGYLGLLSCNKRSFGDRKIVLEPSRADEIFAEGGSDALLGLIVAPTDASAGSKCYKMLISADTHQLFYYKTHTISDSSPKDWLDSDLWKISKNM